MQWLVLHVDQDQKLVVYIVNWSSVDENLIPKLILFNKDLCLAPEAL